MYNLFVGIYFMRVGIHLNKQSEMPSNTLKYILIIH